MEASFNRKALLAAVSTAAAAVPRRHARDVHEHLLLSVGDEHVTAGGTDGDTAVEMVVEGSECKRPGAMLIRPGKLQDILRELHGDEVTVCGSDGRILLKCLGAEYRLLCRDPGVFPALQRGDTDGVTLSCGSLAKAIAATQYAATTTSRYAMAGVLFHWKDGRLRLAATDGRRLAVANVEGEGTAGIESEPVVSAPALKVLSQVIRVSSGETVRYWANHSRAVFQVGENTVSARLVQGMFPDYEALLMLRDHSVKVESQQLASGVRQAQIATSTDSRTVRVSLGNDGIRLMSSADGNSTEIRCDCQCPAEMSMYMDPGYMLDVLKQEAADSIVTLSYTDAESAVGFETETAKCVIMPASR